MWAKLEAEKLAKLRTVQDWLDEVATRRTGSKGTQCVYLKRLANYCNWRKKTPAELLEEDVPYRPGKKMTVAEQELTRYFRWLETEKVAERGKHKGQKGLGRSTALSIYGTIRSFFRYNEVLFYGKTPASGSKAKPSISLPPEKLRAAVDSTDLRGKYSICGLASTGMRPGDFVVLVYGDVKEDYEAGELRLYVEKMSNKEDLMFGVFLSRQATRYLRLMLEERKRAGEKIMKATPLLAHKLEGMTGPISEDQLARIVKDAGEKVGMHLTPKMFRANFRTLASPKVGRDATCKMAAWTIPGVGGHYFLPPKDKCLESYRKIEELFMYEADQKTAEEQQVENLINYCIAERIPMAKIEEIRKVWRTKHLKPDEVAELIRPLIRQARTEAGGLPYQKVLQKELEELFVGVIKGVKKRMAEE